MKIPYSRENFAHVYSSPLILEKLVGREVLNKLILALNGPKEELELLLSHPNG